MDKEAFKEMQEFGGRSCPILNLRVLGIKMTRANDLSGQQHELPI